MTEIQKEITKLGDLWYSLVTLNHHSLCTSIDVQYKDADCRWIIYTEYSYGEKPTYTVAHYGYIYKDVQIKCDTYKEAEKTLLTELKKAISDEITWAKYVLENNSNNEFDEDQKKLAKNILHLTKNYNENIN